MNTTFGWFRSRAKAEAREHRQRDDDQRELEGRDECGGDKRVGRQPDVVVQADEPGLVRVEQVEVGQRHDQRGDDRAGREQREADQPGCDEDVAPDRLTGARPEASSASRESEALSAAPRTCRSCGVTLQDEAGRGRVGGRPGRAGSPARDAASAASWPRNTRRRCPGGSSSAVASSASMSSPSVVRYLFQRALSAVRDFW